jgi:hypothetical protein
MDISTDTGLEIKDGSPAETVVTHAEMMRAFEEFKQTNDQKLAGIERRNADVLLDEKLARIDRTIESHGRRLDEIALKKARPAFGIRQAHGVSSEHKAAFETYVRFGENTSLRALESKALSASSRAVSWLRTLQRRHRTELHQRERIKLPLSANQCPLLVTSGHVQRTSRCPVYPRKRH